MRRPFSPLLLAEISSAVQATLARTRIVNISVLARDIQHRHAQENVALEDIEYALLHMAQHHGGVVEFADDEEGIVAASIPLRKSGRADGRTPDGGDPIVVGPFFNSVIGS